jgi:hypothetical protein
MFEKLRKQIRRMTEQPEWEEFWEQQGNAASAEVAATGEAQRRLLAASVSPVDPGANERYERYRSKYSSPALAEIATMRDAQSILLAKAFSLLDSGYSDTLNREREHHGLPPL